jgi:hypothetical protein
MAAEMKKAGDKEQTGKKSAQQGAGKGFKPLDPLPGLAIWNPENDVAIWRDANSFYAYGTFSPPTAVLTAKILEDGTGTVLFQTNTFLSPPFPGDAPPGSATANWACLCTGLDQLKGGTLFMTCVDGGQEVDPNAHYSPFVHEGGNGGALDARGARSNKY